MLSRMNVWQAVPRMYKAHEVSPVGISQAVQTNWLTASYSSLIEKGIRLSTGQLTWDKTSVYATSEWMALACFSAFLCPCPCLWYFVARLAQHTAAPTMCLDSTGWLGEIISEVCRLSWDCTYLAKCAACLFAFLYFGTCMLWSYNWDVYIFFEIAPKA